jgi:hypothetical protein
VQIESDYIGETDELEPGSGTIRAVEGLVEFDMTPQQAIIGDAHK